MDNYRGGRGSGGGGGDDDDRKALTRHDKLAVVVVGQASESEDEDDDEDEEHEQTEEKVVNIDHMTSETIGKHTRAATTNHEVTDSKLGSQDDLCRSTATNQDSLSNDREQFQSGFGGRQSMYKTNKPSTVKFTESVISNSEALNPRFHSLLHSLLKESNRNLKHNLMTLASTPYVAASKKIGVITRNMVTNLKLLQPATGELQKTNVNLCQLNKSFVTLTGHLASNRKLLL